MSLHRFFLDQQALSEVTDPVFSLGLSEDDRKHFGVLRITPGEHIAVIDAAGVYYECEIVSVTADEVAVRITCREDSHESGVEVTAALALSKGDKIDEVIRHATELGVDRFIPFVSERSVVKLDGERATKRVSRWQAIAKSAAMQSGQRRIPVVEPIIDFKMLPSQLEQADALLIFWEQAPADASIKAALGRYDEHFTDDPLESVALVVGPEGGLSEQEITYLIHEHPSANVVTLGSSILRTETAGVVAPALVLYETGRLG